MQLYYFDLKHFLRQNQVVWSSPGRVDELNTVVLFLYVLRFHPRFLNVLKGLSLCSNPGSVSKDFSQLPCITFIFAQGRVLCPPLHQHQAALQDGSDVSGRHLYMRLVHVFLLHSRDWLKFFLRVEPFSSFSRKIGRSDR